MDGSTPGRTGQSLTGQSLTGQSLTDQPMIGGPFVRNAWYCAAWAQELEAGKIVARTILEEPIVLYRQTDGKVVALADRCPHRFAPLSMGKILSGGSRGDRIMCPYHGLEFSADGACVHNPHGAKNIPSRARVAAYPLIEKHQAIWLWMGDKPADAGVLPDFSVLDTTPPSHITPNDYLVLNANYQLIIDNLMDTSHTSYLHEGILGNSDTVESEVEVNMDGRDMIVSRISTNAEPPGMFKQQWPGCPGRIDNFTHMRYMPPTNMKLMAGICEVGQPNETGVGYWGLHILTPETHASTHYFFTAARYGVRTSETENQELRLRIGKTRRFAFAEQDGPIIEAQHKVIAAAPKPLDPVILSVDPGAVRFKMILQKMMAAERE